MRLSAKLTERDIITANERCTEDNGSDAHVIQYSGYLFWAASIAVYISYTMAIIIAPIITHDIWHFYSAFYNHPFEQRIVNNKRGIFFILYFPQLSYSFLNV